MNGSLFIREWTSQPRSPSHSHYTTCIPFRAPYTTDICAILKNQTWCQLERNDGAIWSESTVPSIRINDNLKMEMEMEIPSS
ncbi:hypothetical protein Tco_0986033 [Tanacetum coccineum]